MNRLLRCCLVLSACMSLAQPAPEAPVAAWSFDRLEGEVALDESGNGNHLRLRSGTLVKGVQGRGLAFSAAGGDAFLPNPGGLRLAEEMTAEVWFNPAVAAPEDFAALLRSEGLFALRFANGGQLGFLLWSGQQVTSLHTSRNQWEAGAWHHAAATYDGTSMRLYVDGEEVPASPVAVPGLRFQAGGALGVGSLHHQYRFKGVIDEVRIFDHARSAAAIQASHRAGRRALRLEAETTVPPEQIGEPRKAFRKPPRDIAMIEDGYLWIDAEDFADYGGWTLDTQFVYLMGSGYLLATGVGTPVADATTEFELAEAGRYRVWVRSRNWIREHSPGTFRLLVNDAPLEPVFGAADSSEWVWEDGGWVSLPAGTVRLALRDLTGYYGRCDALVLTTDGNYRPPPDREGICAERARLTGLSLDPRDGGEYDVVVVGAGSAGVPAAVAAARMGARTALVQNRPVLGGNASDECGVPLNGAATHHRDARETGIAEEVARHRAHHGFRRYSAPFQMLCDAEPNLSVFLNKHVFDVEMADDRTIRAVQAVDTLTGAITVYRGTFFIDTTGDGWVGYYAKADYRLGREARDEFNESLAPEEADTQTMSGCLMGDGLGFRATNIGREVPFVRPPWAREIDLIDSPGRRVRRVGGGEWWMEHPNDIDDLYRAEEARDKLITIAFSYFDYVKNKSSLREEARTYALSHIPHMNAKRESRRLVGDYILTQNDCEAGAVFPDRISYGGWPLDIHHPDGIFSGEAGSFWCNAHVPIHTIPYRILYSRNIENLLFAGRCASVTHIALGTVRVQSTLATLGQAAGTAAALCIERQTTPRGIYRNHIRDLQQILLKNDQTIPGIVNEDPADLARSATATASSTAEFVEFRRLDVKTGARHELAMGRGMVFPWVHGRLDAIHVLATSTVDEARSLRLRLRSAADPAELSAAEDVAVAEATLGPRAIQWLRFEIGRDLPGPYAWFWIERSDGVHLSLMDSAPPRSARFYGGEGNWTLVESQFYAFHTTPDLAVPVRFAPEMAINGIARKWDGKTNMWSSDPRQELPQWLELDFGRERAFTSVYLTFDTNLAPRVPTEACPPEAVRDYQVEVETPDGGWRTVAEVRGNFLRRRIHRFPEVVSRRMRVNVLATNGVKEARIFEVRVYHE